MRCTCIPGREHWTEVSAQSWTVVQTALLAILVVGFCVALSPQRGDLIARRSTAARKRVLATWLGTIQSPWNLGLIFGTS